MPIPGLCRVGGALSTFALVRGEEVSDEIGIIRDGVSITCTGLSSSKIWVLFALPRHTRIAPRTREQATDHRGRDSNNTIPRNPAHTKVSIRPGTRRFLLVRS